MTDVASQTPTCIGIILDGNRRWARAQGKPTLFGHKEGYENFKRAAGWVRDAGIKHFVVFAFSTENWNRSQEEVSYLMNLLLELAKTQMPDLAKEKTRVRFLGERERISKELRTAIDSVERESAHYTDFNVWVCLSYGARLEITTAARALQEKGIEITEASLRGAMWSAEMPDPDIIVRTSGEQRLSNFLLWQAAYSEIFFVDVHWPAFSQEDLKKVLDEYAARERRHGR